MYLTTHPTDFTERNTQKAFQKIEQHKNSSNRFYVNNGDGTYTEKHAAVGIDNHAYSLSVTVGDLNGDGFLDVYVANDFAMYDFVYINDGHGKFKDESLKVLKKTSINAMGGVHTSTCFSYLNTRKYTSILLMLKPAKVTSFFRFSYLVS